MGNAKRKGARNEKKCIDALEDEGYIAERDGQGRWNTDMFDLVDIVATHPGRKLKFVQVKSNTASGKNAYEERGLEVLNLDHVEFELWVWHDYNGWRKFRLTEEGFEKFVDER